jgi:hypothetical protein
MGLGRKWRGWVLSLDFESILLLLLFFLKKKEQKKKRSKNDRRGTCHITFVILQ